MTPRLLRAAMTQTVSAYADMPATRGELARIELPIDAIREANIAHNVELVASAARQGGRIVCLGELFPTPYFALGRDARWLAAAEDATDGPSVRAMREAARRLGVVIVAPIYEYDADDDVRYNTAVVIDHMGEVLGRYRKVHIPQGQNERAAFHEAFYYERSRGGLSGGRANVSSNPWFPVFDAGLARIGVAICYDRHFEGVMRTLAGEGAQIVFSPAVTFGEKSARMWHHEFATDAARHRLFIGGSNRQGREAPWNLEFHGGGYFVGPDGKPLPDLSDDDRVIVAELDLDELTRADASGWDLPRDARPDTYS